MKKWIWIGVAALVVIFFYATYNGFVNKEEGVKTAWANVETQYQRRADLIPNLVNTVKGYAAHETQTFTEVTEARAKATSINLSADDLTPEKLAEFQQAQAQVRSALGRLIAVSESYPDLKANQNFLELQAQLEGTENRISVARKQFNEVARTYNVSVRRRDLVPLAVMGLLFSFSSLFLFESYNHMDAGIASTILFLYPVLVAVIMAVGFHEKVSRITMLSILLAFTGIAMLYKGGGEPLSFLGVALVFLSSLCYAVYIVGVNRSSLRGLPTEKLTFYALLFGLSVYVVRLRFCADLQAIPTPGLWINAVSLALFPTIVSLVTMAAAIRAIGSTPTAILGALEPLTALFFGVVVFGERLTPRIVLGVVLILAAVTLIIAGRSLHIPFPHLRFRRAR